MNFSIAKAISLNLRTNATQFQSLVNESMHIFILFFVK